MKMRSNRFRGGWVLPLLTVILGAGCAGAPSPAETSGIPKKHQTVVCGDIRRVGEGFVPSDIRNAFLQKPRKSAHIYTEWFDLTPGQTYLVRWDYYRADGELVETKAYRFIPPEPRAYTAGRVSLDPETGFPTGIFVTEVYINDVFASAVRFLVAGDEAERERLISELEELERGEAPDP